MDFDEHIFLIGGQDPERLFDGAKSTVLHCPPSNGAKENSAWQFIRPMQEERCRLSALTTDDAKILVLGGSTAKGPLLSSIECYDAEQDEWYLDYLPPMSSRRKDFGAVFVDGAIYVVGGDAFGTAERCDPREGCWTLLPAPAKNREQHGTAAIERSIFVAAGLYSGDTIERFDLRSHRWEAVEPLSQSRKGLTLSAIGRRLFAIGGWSIARSYIDQVDTYDLATKKWTIASEAMQTARSLHCATVAGDDRIVVFGSHSKHSAQHGVIFDSTSQRWCAFDRWLPVGRCSAAVVLLPDGCVPARQSKRSSGKVPNDVPDELPPSYDEAMAMSFGSSLPMMMIDE